MATVSDALGQEQLLLGAEVSPDGLATAVARDAAFHAVATGHPSEVHTETVRVRGAQAGS